jgi:hypothetical protein
MNAVTGPENIANATRIMSKCLIFSMWRDLGRRTGCLPNYDNSKTNLQTKLRMTGKTNNSVRNSVPVKVVELLPFNRSISTLASTNCWIMSSCSCAISASFAHPPKSRHTKKKPLGQPFRHLPISRFGCHFPIIIKCRNWRTTRPDAPLAN